MSSLETSVTLEEVFAVVNAKRVPMAPELAGYLALEIAEGADAAGGDVDPRFVFIGEEGTVGLVRPKREGATGDAELSIRAILARLLEASGSQTPALAAASRRKGAGGLPSLVEELEAALIPVNRAAGRRALARLAREAKRVTLGVGRNANVPPSEGRRGSAPSYSAIVQPAGERAPTPPPPEAAPEPASPPRRVSPSSAQFAPEEEPTKMRGSSIPPATPAKAIELTPSIPIVEGSDPSAGSAVYEPTPSRPRDSVDSLLAQFEASSSAIPKDRDIGRELKAMAGIDATAPPPRAAPKEKDDVDSLLAMSTEPTGPVRPANARPPSVRPPKVAEKLPKPTSPVAAPPSPAVPARDPTPAPPAADERHIPTGPAHRVRMKSTTGETRRTRGSTFAIVILALVFVGLAGVAVWRIKPGFLSGRTPEKVEQERAAHEAERARIAAEQQALNCRASLTVTDVPPNAEVLERVGQAPVDVEKMPVGRRLEFVATAEGHAPKRTVVPAGAAWDNGPDGKPRYEVAVQLEASRAKPGAADLWPAGEPGMAVGGDGPPGTVHIVSTPKGAEVWLLVGIGPEARLEQLKCGQDVDVLVAGPTALRKRLHVSGSDFASQEKDSRGTSVRTARVSAK